MEKIILDDILLNNINNIKLEEFNEKLEGLLDMIKEDSY